MAELSADLFESIKSVIVENIEEYDVEITNNDKGEGFIGEVLFGTVAHKINKKKKLFVVKQERKGEETRIEGNDSMVQNEMKFYGVIWPYLQKYYKEASGKDLNMLPKCFGTSEIGRRRIFLENIKTIGYELQEKSKSFTDEQIRAVFETYGIYHGVSMALREQNYEQYQELISKQVNLLKDVLKEDHMFCKGITEKFRQAQEYFDPVKEKCIVEKLLIYEKSCLEPIRQLVNEDLPRGVLTHGDCWSNNFMFKFDDERKLQDVKFIDFQVCCHSHPIFDLSYFLFAGATGELLNKIDDYQEVYHSSLSDTLNEFGLSAESVYSFDTFRQDWKKYCKYGASMGLLVWEPKLLKQEDLPDVATELVFHVKLSDKMQEQYMKIVRDLINYMYNNDCL